MNFNFLLVVLINFLPVKEDPSLLYESENLIIKKITENTFLHTSYIITDDFGKIACNGLIFKDGRRAIIVDTPVTFEAARELVRWLRVIKNLKTIGVIATHYHRDCVGGLEAFHAKAIQSYSQQVTQEMAKKIGMPVPMNVVDNNHKFKVGKKFIGFHYPGAGHSKDNMVLHIPSEQLLYGGCLVKSVGAAEGYTGDANLGQWSNSIEDIRQAYPDLKIVVPGHGSFGGTELLDYTYELFEKYQQNSLK